MKPGPVFSGQVNISKAELSKMDYPTFPLFGFLIVETPQSDTEELDWILNSDLREFAVNQ
jgi:hypothetical protein